MPYLLPDDITPTDFKCLTIRIPDDPQWESTFWGALTELCKWFNFERDEAHHATIVAHLWQEWIEAAMACNTITAMEFFEGKLRIQFCNSSTWVNVGSLGNFGVRFENGALQYDLDGDGNYDVTQYTTFAQNVYQQGLVPATATDIICYSATELAEQVTDDFQDMLQLLNAATTFFLGTGVDFARTIAWSLPVWLTAGIDDAMLLQIAAAYNFTTAAQEYFIEQLNDIDVKREVANFIYCALVESLVTVDGITTLENFEDNLISVVGSYFIAIPISLVSDVLTLDFGSIIQDAIGFPNKAIAGIAIGYALAQKQIMADALHISDTWTALFQGLAVQAAYFDERDCSGFDCLPELIVTFNEETNTVPYTLSAWGTVQVVSGRDWLRKTGTGNVADGSHRVQFTANFEEPVALVGFSCDVYALTSPPSTPRTFGITIWDGATQIYIHNDTLSEGTVHTLTGSFTPGTYSNLIFRLATGTLTGSSQDLRLDDIRFTRA